jgi:hypothetical protein
MLDVAMSKNLSNVKFVSADVYALDPIAGDFNKLWAGLAIYC